MVIEEQAKPIEISPSLLGTLKLDGIEVPYIDLETVPRASTELIIDDTEYTFVRSFLIKGHSAVMPAAVRELIAQGKRVLVAERPERYYVYAA